MRILRAARSGAAPRVKSLLLGSGSYSLFRRAAPSRRVAILRYHAICGPEGYAYAEPAICVSRSAFEAHVAYLTSNYRVLPLPEAVRFIRQGRSLPANAVVLTFDDGYADNLWAARLLERYGATATFYVTAGCLAGEAPFWPAEIRELVARIGDPEIRLRIGDAEVVITLATDDDRQRATRTLAALIKAHTIPARERLREQLRAAAHGDAVGSPMLTWDEVREMHGRGMTIGAHTVTHPNLPNAGPADAWREVAGSKQRVDRELGAPVTMFSYPNGGAERYMTDEIARMVAEAGFEAATTSRNGFASRGSSLFALERVQVAERLEDLVFALEVERFAFKPAPRPVNGNLYAGHGR
ncbi:MAG TPA: polysaccharide deacetylase family protein [Vicinamibacterales bacterium]|nr:polysaccharide deacetylase family protein [Vicinamibacterales bacterium]